MFRINSTKQLVNFLVRYDPKKECNIHRSDMFDKRAHLFGVTTDEELASTLIITNIDDFEMLGKQDSPSYSVNHLYVDSDSEYKPDFISRYLIKNTSLTPTYLITDCHRFNKDLDWKIITNNDMTDLMVRGLINTDLYDLHKRKPFVYKKRNVLARLINKIMY